MGNGSSHAAGGAGGSGSGAGVPGPGAGSGARGTQPMHWQHSLPSDPQQKASHLKVLPDLDTNPRLRSTNNGAILHSGGTISGGRRPLSLALPHDRDPVHNQVHRSKSITQEIYEGERQQVQPRFSYLSNQRDPLHRSHTHLHLEEPISEPFSVQSKRFGSEPDLRNSEEIIPSKTKVKNMKKKYKAPPPPPTQTQGSSSPDSWNAPHAYDHHVPQPPSRKLRLFKTRAETKKTTKHNHDIKPNGYTHHSQDPKRSFDLEAPRHHPNDIFEQTRYNEREKLFRSPSRERDEYLKYPSSREDDMVQTHSSLKREENILQSAFSRQELIRTKHSQQNMYKEKAKGTESRFESNKGFRNSERFKKQSIDPLLIRREKSFDNSLVQESLNQNGVNRMHNERKNLLESQNKFNDRDDTHVEYRYKDREDKTNAINNRKSAPALGTSTGIASDDFQKELMMATKKLRNVVNSRLSPERAENNNKFTPTKPSYKKENDSKINIAESKIVKEKIVTKQDDRNTKNLAMNGARITAVQTKSNIQTMDRFKQNSPADRTSRIVREDKQEETKTVSKLNGTKVLPTDKVGRENVRNRRESRVLADRGQASGKESTPEQSPSRVKQEAAWDKNQANQPSKSFYFGMDKTIQPVAEQELDAHEKVRRHLEMNYKDFPKTNGYPVEEEVIQQTNKHDYNTRLDLPQGSSESALSSEPEHEDLMSEEKNPHGIALQLRPTLPKKQLEIPRFSPAAAWRQLASLEAQEAVLPPAAPPPPPAPEERIHRQQRNRWAARPDRGSHDKSGDSGISGDANNDDSGDVAPASPPIARREEPSKRSLLSAWTPQQDLEEESSSDAGVDSPHSANTDHAPAKFSARQQVFSLSLPRETHLVNLGDKNKQFQQPFNSLQKLKKSVSGAIGSALGSKRIDADLEENDGIEQAESNWFLSRSAPNSLNNGLNTQKVKLSTAKSNDSGQQQTPPSSDQEDDRMPPVLPSMMRQQPPFSYLATGGHVMYLPRYDSGLDSQPYEGGGRGLQPLSLPCRAEPPLRVPVRMEEEPEQRSDGELEEEKHKSFLDGRMMSRSKSSGEIILSQRNAASKPRTKGKRFTFQSTVRQIERRRLADKLSREAESKERQRLTELEAMRRVEEEFQRKRAREKASIRQQLRLVSLDESCSSLPSSWGGQGRSEPEGAVSPSPPPASRNSGGSATGGRKISGGTPSPSPKGGATPSPRIGGSRIASKTSTEYRQPREYKDYRRAPSTPVLPPAVHPPACYNMPRATPAGRTPIGGWEADPDNYRREFARGRRPPSSSGSDLSQSGRLLTPPRSS